MPEPPPQGPQPPEGLGYEEMKRWVEAAVKRELEGLERGRPLQLNLSAYQAWLLLQLLQQGFHRLGGDAKLLARDLGGTIVDGYLPEGTVLRRFADVGWTEKIIRVSAHDVSDTEPFGDGVAVPDAFRRAFGIQ